MTGVAAIALCAAFTSCSSKDELYNPEVVKGNEAASIVEKYNQAFLKYVGGTIASDQTWGFGGYETAAKTRTINVNGNLWKDCPVVGNTEEADVLAYLSTLQTKEKNPVRLQNYFVTQIHKGDEPYYNVGGGYVGVGSDKMNNLHIAMSDGLTINNGALSAEGATAWDHINNFNAGTCNDWGAGDKDGEGNTMVINGGTFDFAYQGAEDSKYHNRWCSIDGANVPKTGGGNYAGYYYICFDFEQDAPTKTVFYIDFQWTHQTDAGNWQTDNKSIEYKIDGSYDNDHKSDIVTAMGGKFTYEGQEYDLTANMIRVANIEGANQNVNPNSSYKDWIVRLVKAERENEPDPDDVCIIAEDLSADDDTDFDFNDVVFTVHYTSATAADVTLYAAGGTLPLKVAGYEVHDKFGFPDADPVTGKYKMINTGAKADVNGVATQTFSVSGISKSNRGNDIAITVNKGTAEAPNWIPLTATGGAPAAKLCVGVDFATGNKWCAERESIKTKYPVFSQWVALNPTQIWWK